MIFLCNSDKAEIITEKRDHCILVLSLFYAVIKHHDKGQFKEESLF